MNLLQQLVMLVVTGICAGLAELVFGYDRGGMVVALIIGVIGAYIGTALVGLLPSGLPLTLQIGTTQVNLLATFIGALLVVTALSVFETFWFNRRVRTAR